MGELKQVTLSQQLFVLNIVLFLNFHVKGLSKFGTFLPKMTHNTQNMFILPK